MVQADQGLMADARRMAHRLDVALTALDAGQLADAGSYAARVEFFLERGGESVGLRATSITPLGLFVHTAFLLEAGTEVWVHFPDPSTHRRIEACARVMATHTEGQDIGMALEFKQVRRADWRALWETWGV